jgi:hypothetical protein
MMQHCPDHLSGVSPLLLSDRLLTLAEDADRAGYRGMAERLLDLAEQVLDEPAWHSPPVATRHRRAPHA